MGALRGVVRVVLIIIAAALAFVAIGAIVMLLRTRFAAPAGTGDERNAMTPAAFIEAFNSGETPDGMQLDTKYDESLTGRNDTYVWRIVPVVGDADHIIRLIGSSKSAAGFEGEDWNVLFIQVKEVVDAKEAETAALDAIAKYIYNQFFPEADELERSKTAMKIEFMKEFEDGWAVHGGPSKYMRYSSFGEAPDQPGRHLRTIAFSRYQDGNASVDFMFGE